jgi:steroid delta-isomerase-like uncharacterized protein
MDAAEIRGLVDRWFDCWSRHDAAAAAQFHATNGVAESPMYATLNGRKAIEEAYRAFATSFPDWTAKLDAIVVEAPYAAIFTTVNATHVNEFFGLPGTGRRIEFRNCQLMRIEDGLIQHVRRIYDFTGILVQVGVLQAKPAKPSRVPG